MGKLPEVQYSTGSTNYVGKWTFGSNGDTVLVAAALPGLGTVKITLEALTYGAGMGLRLLVVISALPCTLMRYTR